MCNSLHPVNLRITKSLREHERWELPHCHKFMRKLHYNKIISCAYQIIRQTAQTNQCTLVNYLKLWKLASNLNRKSMAYNLHILMNNPLCKKATIHQLTTMLATSKKALFPGHNYLLTTGANDLTLYRPSEGDN